MSDDGIRMRIAILQGSVRPDNYTSKATAIVVDELRKQRDVEARLLDPSTLNLAPPGMTSEDSRAQELEDAIRSADGVILATPEYHGSFSSVMKLAIENMGFPSALSGKPVALLGVAAGRIGAIKSLEHLRSVVSHVGGIVLPGPVSVAGVRGYFDDQGKINDRSMEQAIRSVATNLLSYVHAHTCPPKCLEEMVRERAA